jgi:hypothetical protein
MNMLSFLPGHPVEEIRRAESQRIDVIARSRQKQAEYLECGRAAGFRLVRVVSDQVLTAIKQLSAMPKDGVSERWENS